MRIKRAINKNKHKRAILKQAKGFWGERSKLYRVANQAVMKSGKYAYIGRRLRKRNMRRLWIQRINAECHNNGITYNKFICGLKKNNITLDRKILADMAVNDKVGFAKLVKEVKE